ncbi:sensor histidine kinase [Nocardioides ferulae]|uniref:sensor histidine kinase n=1 Tax=Nocardioides ferulae TaxID=2340821 RepID=UPI000EB46CD2|nr:ATP-binding protein [Nocardioides ferulae]
MSTTTSLAVQRRHFHTALIAYGLGCVVLALLYFPAWSAGIAEAASLAGLLAVPAAGIVGCLLRARVTSGRRRRAWLLIVVAGAVAMLSNVWTAAAGSDPVDHPSLVSDLLIISAQLLAIASLIQFPTARRRRFDLMLIGLDALVMGMAVLSSTIVLVYGEVLDSVSDFDGPTRYTSLLFPPLDVVLATVALLLVLRSSGTDRPPLVLVASGFVMYAVTDLAFAVQVAQASFEFGTVVDLGWMAGYLLIGLASWYPSVPQRQPVATDVTSRTVDTALVYSVLLFAASVQLVASRSFTLTQGGLWLVLVLAVATRQILLSYDNATLRRGLERQVRAQTDDLRRLARQNEVLLASVGDGIYGVDADGRITFVNPSGAAALGYRADELLGRHAHEEFHAPAPDGTAYPFEGCYIAEAITQGLSANAEEDTYLRRDRQPFPVEITASPLLDDHQVRGAVVVFRDVTQRREIDRMKNEFLSVVSHELRTPLTSIRGSLGLIASGRFGALNERGESLVSIALESSERLTRLINDLLDLERIEGGNRPLDLHQHEAADLVTGSVTEMQGFARDRGVRLVAAPSSGRVVADRDRIVQTLTNLLNNAIKYSDEGGEVTVEARLHETEVTFRVCDQGRGIPSDKLESVFERFQQVDSSDARQKGGTGLGLAISREIVQRHGGRIWAESELGSGTTVTFTLPASGHGPAPH